MAGIPLAGGAIHVRLWTRFGATWQHRDYVLDTASLMEPVEHISPSLSTVLDSDAAIFTRLSVPGATRYRPNSGHIVKGTQTYAANFDCSAPSTLARQTAINYGTIQVPPGRCLDTYCNDQDRAHGTVGDQS